MKRQPTEWEKIFANEMTNKRLISKILKAHATLYKKTIKKWLEVLNRHLQRRQTDGQKSHEKIFNITNY